MNGPRHVVIAMAFTAILFLIAGDKWNKPGSAYNPATYVPVKPATKAS